jgi:uncharacterized protein (TIGR04255 family)
MKETPVGAKMNNAPVFYTLAQVGFNPISVMGDYVPKIQERLRRTGFPDFRTETLHRVEFRQKVGEQPEIETHVVPRWSFMNSKGIEGYILGTDSIVFHTTVYDTFPVFTEQFLMGLALVHEAATLAYTERVGLRYLDAVSPHAGEALDAYLSQTVLGLHRALQGTLAHSFTETVVQNASGTLVSRVVIRDDTLAVPPDLHPLNLKVGDRFASIKGLHAILDNDQFAADRTDFNLDEVMTKLGSMHDRIEEVFHATVTPFALEQWK